MFLYPTLPVGDGLWLYCGATAGVLTPFPVPPLSSTHLHSPLTGQRSQVDTGVRLNLIQM